MGKAIYGQRPYMGFNTVGQENQTQKTIEFNTVDRKTRPRDHIWAKTIYGIQHSGTGKSDPKDDRIQHSWQENQTQRPYMGKALYGQRPYMGFNTVGQENPTQKTIEFNTVGRKTRPETIYGQSHIWAKTIYGIQHSGTGKSDPKDDRIQHSWQENQTQRPYMGKALYGQRPYMGFNTVGQENQTQKTIEFNTVGRKTRPRDHIWAKPYMGKDHIWDSTQWDRKIRPKRRYNSTQLAGKPDPETIYGQRPYMGFNTVG